MKKSLNKIVVSLQIMLILLSNVSVYANESSTEILSEDIK